MSTDCAGACRCCCGDAFSSAAAAADVCDVVVDDVVRCAEPCEPGSCETGLLCWRAAETGTETDWMRLAGMPLTSMLVQDVVVGCVVEPRSLVASMSGSFCEVPVVVEVCVVFK